jgi:hypothetical protein
MVENDFFFERWDENASHIVKSIINSDIHLLRYWISFLRSYNEIGIYSKWIYNIGFIACIFNLSFSFIRICYWVWEFAFENLMNFIKCSFYLEIFPYLSSKIHILKYLCSYHWYHSELLMPKFYDMIYFWHFLSLAKIK